MKDAAYTAGLMVLAGIGALLLSVALVVRLFRPRRWPRAGGQTHRSYWSGPL